MQAGFFLGPTILGGMYSTNTDSTQLLRLASVARIFFMFLVGLEIDISHLRHMLSTATMINVISMSTCMLLSIVSAPPLHRLININGSLLELVLVVFLIFFNTASPILIRVVNELKLTMTKVGRLAIAAAIITDILCLVLLAVINIMCGERRKFGNVSAGRRAASCFGAFVVLAVTSIMIRYMVKWVNKWNRHNRLVGDDVAFYFLMTVFSASMCFDILGYDPMMGSFIFGLVIQRDGPLARTIVERLTYAVYNLILPIYFGVAGLQVDIKMFVFKEVVVTTAAVIFLGALGKIGGTMGVAMYMGMPMNEGLVLSSLLNIKGHVNLMVISLGTKYGVSACS